MNPVIPHGGSDPFCMFLSLAFMTIDEHYFPSWYFKHPQAGENHCVLTVRRRASFFLALSVTPMRHDHAVSRNFNSGARLPWDSVCIPRFLFSALEAAAVPCDSDEGSALRSPVRQTEDRAELHTGASLLSEGSERNSAFLTFENQAESHWTVGNWKSRTKFPLFPHLNYFTSDSMTIKLLKWR